VDQKSEVLTKIQVQGNMFTDHGSKAMWSALQEVKEVRMSNQEPPCWTPFNFSSLCQLCNEKFTWNSTSDSEAQVKKDKHNCRSCGRLVCSMCSSKTKSVPHIGLNSPSRVCDLCALSPYHLVDKQHQPEFVHTNSSIIM